jgi:nucleoside-diphosphate-sugar epimerase
MKVFVAGATGALGKRLVPLLVASGYEVVAMTRSQEKADGLRAARADPVVADGLDRAAVKRAVMRSEPDVVIHQMTALTGVTNFKNFDKEFAATNLLRTEGTDHLLEAALAVGAQRFIAYSFGGWNYERTGTAPKRETDPFDPSPPAKQRASLAAIRYLENAVTGTDGIEGVVLRSANFVGPGTSFADDGDVARMARKRLVPVVGAGTGIWSFIHVDDAARATIAAIGHGAPGIYNIADDVPAAVAEWVPELARALGAKPPRHVPARIGRLVRGEVGVSLMTGVRGISNAKAVRELGWQPRYPSYRESFRAGLPELPLPAVHTSSTVTQTRSVDSRCVSSTEGSDDAQ